MNKPDIALDLLHASTAARLAGVSVSTIRLWVLSGRLPAIVTAEGVRLIRRYDVERIAAERLAGREGRQREQRGVPVPTV